MRRVHRVLFALAVALAASVVVFGQSAPALTELEQTKVELLQVRTAYAQLLSQYDGCKAEVGAVYNTLGKLRADLASKELTAEEARVKAEIERGHDGWDWNSKTGAFTKK
jgi:uncharacterized protein YvpB